MNRSTGLLTVGRHPFRALVAMGAALALTGCVLPDEIAKLEKRVTDLQREVQRMSLDQQAATERLESVAQEIGAADDGISRTEFADIGIKLDEIRRQQAVLDQRITDSHRRIDRVSQSVEANRVLLQRVASGVGPHTPTAPPGTVPEVPGGPVGPSTRTREGPVALPSPEELYNAAYADFSKGNYPLAISGFEEYGARYPDSDLADNALYWIGECYFSQGDYDAAIQAFDRMLERYPQSDRTPAANLKKGLAYLEQNQIRRAIVQLHFVEDSYPGSDESRIARDKLASLGALSR